ncbi:MAG TPA: hypothetical protein VKD90_29585 [Gemmataceae bacterium]|nr:hypothetical protein [Gemmataceae bacterium]
MSVRTAVRYSISVSVLALTAATLAGEPKEGTVRALDVKVERPAKGRVTQPVAIRSADEMAKAIADEAAVAAVKKAVDFEKEQVVYFSWSGSGQDKITFESSGGAAPTVTFTYTPGLTRDLRPHARLFALPKDATYKVVTAGR